MVPRRIHKETLCTILSVVHRKEAIEIEISLARAKKGRQRYLSYQQLNNCIERSPVDKSI